MIFYLYLKEEFPIWFNFFNEVFTEEIASKYAKYFVEHRMSFEQLRYIKMDYLEIMGINIGDCITILNHPKVKGIVLNPNSNINPKSYQISIKIINIYCIKTLLQSFFFLMLGFPIENLIRPDTLERCKIKKKNS